MWSPTFTNQRWTASPRAFQETPVEAEAALEALPTTAAVGKPNKASINGGSPIAGGFVNGKSIYNHIYMEVLLMENTCLLHVYMAL